MAIATEVFGLAERSNRKSTYIRSVITLGSLAWAMTPRMAFAPGKAGHSMLPVNPGVRL